MYLNDIEKEFYLNGFKGIDIGSIKLFLLLYADDMTMFSFVCLFVLMLYVPVNSYGHVGTSPPISWDFYPALR